MNNYDSFGLPMTNAKENKENPSILNNRSTIGKFKEDIVNAVFQIEDKLTNSTNSLENHFIMRSETVDNRIILLEEQISKLSRQMHELNVKAEKTNEAYQIEKKNNEQILTNEIRLNSLDKNLTNAINKYDKLFLANLVLPGQIGDYCRFKNVKECLDYVLTQIGLFNSLIEKSAAEMNLRKDKYDNSLKQLSFQVEHMKKSYISTVALELLEEKIDNKFKNVNEFISQVQMENNKYAISLRDNSQLLQKELIKLKDAKESMESHNNHLLREFNDKIINTNEHFNHLKTQFNKISRQFSELVEFIKDVRFKKNINSEVTKNDIRKLTNNLLNDEATTNGVSINNMNDSLQQIDMDQEILTENDTLSLRVSKDSEQPKKSKLLFISTSCSMIRSAQNISHKFKTQKIPNKKIKKKKIYITSKPSNTSLNKISNVKSKSVDKKSKSPTRSNFTSMIDKTNNNILSTEIDTNNKFNSKINKVKLGKISKPKTHQPKDNYTSNAITLN